MTFAKHNFFRLIACVSLTIICALMFPGAALADRIDGKWCSPEGRHVEIQGRQITTHSGVKMDGEYGRHSFSYTAPAAEPDAGSTMYMVLLNEETMEVRAGNPVARAIVWKRCQNIS